MPDFDAIMCHEKFDKFQFFFCSSKIFVYKKFEQELFKELFQITC